MYYVIQRHHGDPKKQYIAYSVPRYISSENSQNVIFEFKHEGQIKRKWTSKQEIVLLTDNRALFEKVLRELEELKQAHLKKIDAAEQQLNTAITQMLSEMQKQFETIKNRDNG